MGRGGGRARRSGAPLAHTEQHAGRGALDPWLTRSSTPTGLLGRSSGGPRRIWSRGRSAQAASMAAGGASGLPPFWWSTSGPVAVLARSPSSAPLLPPPLGGGAPRGHGPCVALRGGGRSGGEGQAAPEQGREDGGSWRRGGQGRSRPERGSRSGGRHERLGARQQERRRRRGEAPAGSRSSGPSAGSRMSTYFFCLPKMFWYRLVFPTGTHGCLRHRLRNPVS